MEGGPGSQPPDSAGEGAGTVPVEPWVAGGQPGCSAGCLGWIHEARNAGSTGASSRPFWWPGFGDWGIWGLGDLESWGSGGDREAGNSGRRVKPEGAPASQAEEEPHLDRTGSWRFRDLGCSEPLHSSSPSRGLLDERWPEGISETRARIESASGIFHARSPWLKRRLGSRSPVLASLAFPISRFPGHPQSPSPAKKARSARSFRASKHSVLHEPSMGPDQRALSETAPC